MMGCQEYINDFKKEKKKVNKEQVQYMYGRYKAEMTFEYASIQNYSMVKAQKGLINNIIYYLGLGYEDKFLTDKIVEGKFCILVYEGSERVNGIIKDLNRVR